MCLKIFLPTTILLGISGVGHAEQTLQKDDKSSKPNIIYISNCSKLILQI